jgi:hypothetical protein
MRDRARAAVFALLIGLLLLAPLSALGEGPLIPLSEENKKDVALLGEGVVGKAVPAEPIVDLTHLAGIRQGTWEYRIVSGDDEGKTTTESYEKIENGSWKRIIGTTMIEYITLSDDAWSKYAEIDLDFNYRSDFDPPVHHAANWEPGGSTVIESKIKVTKVGEPDDVKYHGKMKATVSYEGAYEVTTPAGTFEAALMKGVFEIKVGPAHVTDVQYLFFAPGVGKVAEIEALSVSALLLYHSHDKTAKVLTKHPSARK